ncbi:MAG: hypothetical protein DCC55_11415 [Chloroflexi bacterium]|nr:MAG: hypothetical protein DCC55_11415 [Chloroflexota bacterium]
MRLAGSYHAYHNAPQDMFNDWMASLFLRDRKWVASYATRGPEMLEPDAPSPNSIPGFDISLVAVGMSQVVSTFVAAAEKASLAMAQLGMTAAISPDAIKKVRRKMLELELTRFMPKRWAVALAERWPESWALPSELIDMVNPQYLVEDTLTSCRHWLGRRLGELSDWLLEDWEE